MKRFAKRILAVACSVLVSPATALCLLQMRMGDPDRSFTAWFQLFSVIPGLAGVHLRHAFLRATSARCGDDACVSFGTLFSHAGVTIGRTVYIGNYCSIGNVAIEDDVLIASHVSIMNGCRQHGTERLDIPLREQPGVFQPITIGCDSWIGERAIIAADVGRHCIIGAGSLVLSPIPDYCIAVGSPARIIRDRRGPAQASSVDKSFERVNSAMARLQL